MSADEVRYRPVLADFPPTRGAYRGSRVGCSRSIRRASGGTSMSTGWRIPSTIVQDVGSADRILDVHLRGCRSAS